MNTAPFNQADKQSNQPLLGGLPVRTNLRAGAWDDIDDQAKALWGKLTGALASATSSTPASTPAATTTPAA